jgi:hypothetical protein
VTRTGKTQWHGSRLVAGRTGTGRPTIRAKGIHGSGAGDVPNRLRVSPPSEEPTHYIDEQAHSAAISIYAEDRDLEIRDIFWAPFKRL